MVDDVYTTVGHSLECRRNHPTAERQHKLHLFPPTGSLDFVAIDFLVFVPNTSAGNQFIVVMTDRLLKLAKATLKTKTTADTFAAFFIIDNVAKFRIPTKVLTDHGPQFRTKFFHMICNELPVKPLTTREYHPQSTDKLNVIAPIPFRNFSTKLNRTEKTQTVKLYT